MLGKIAWASLVAYLALLIVGQAYAELRLFDLRELDRNLLDYTWQLELVYEAELGRWSGRDFHYARGPLFQLLAYWASRPGPIDAARTFALMHALYKLLGLAVAFALVRSEVRGTAARLAAFGLLAILAFAAGISTFRALLSAAVIVAHLPGDEDDDLGSWKRPAIAAGALLVALSISFDRLVLGIVSIGAIFVYEAIARLRRGESMRPAWLRLGKTSAAFGVGLLSISILVWPSGFRFWSYFAGQAQVASGYRALGAAWSAEVRPANVAGFVIAAFALAVAVSFVRSVNWRLGAWLFAAVPLAAFAVVVPDRGHVYVGVLPLVVMLVLIAFRADGHDRVRWASGILAGVFGLGWFGAFPGDLWVSPTTLSPAAELLRGRLTRDTAFTTDVGNALAWARTLAPEERASCIALNPGMTVVHPLAGLPGPTLLRPRWTIDQQARLSEDLRRMRCPHYVHHLRSFDEMRGAEWQLGQDWLTLAELYEPVRRIGPATYALALRPEPMPARRAELPALGRFESVTIPGELRIPLGKAIEPTTLVEMKYRLDANALSALAGKLPDVDYRFESEGRPLSELRPLFHVEANHEAVVHLAVDAEAVERRWLLGERVHRSEQADTLVLRFASRGLLGPRRVGLAIRSLAALDPGTPAAPNAEPACQPSLDLAAAFSDGRGFARNVAPRPSATKISVHSNPLGQHLAEVFVPVRPCADSCLYADLGLEPVFRGDGVEFQVHVIDRDERALLLGRRVLPGAAPIRAELPLWPWQNSEILLRVGTSPVQSPELDYAFVNAPRIGRCSARGEIAAAVRDKRARIDGPIQPRGDDFELGPERTRVAYPLRVTRETCFHELLEVTGRPEARFAFELYVSVDDVDHRVFKHRVEGKTGLFEPNSVSLHDWDERDVELVLLATPEDAAPGDRAFIRRPRLVRCSEIR